VSDPVETLITAPAEVVESRPFWLSVLRWTAWLAMLIAVIAFVSRHGGGAFIYQNF
jgi:hypothetical protein